MDYYKDIVKPENEEIITHKCGRFRWNKINNKLYHIDRKYKIEGEMRYDEEEKMWEIWLYPC